MKHLKRYQIFESVNDKDFYWGCASETIDIITKILTIRSIKFNSAYNTYLTEEDKKNIDGHHEDPYLFKFWFNDLNGVSCSIYINGSLYSPVKHRRGRFISQDRWYTGETVSVDIFIGGEYGVNIESGKELMDKLSKSKLELPIPNWVKQINEFQ